MKVASNRTIIQVPANLDNPNLTRFLEALVKQIDIAFGYRGDSPFTGGTSGTGLTFQEVQEWVNQNFSRRDGTNTYTGKVSYSFDPVFSNARELISKAYVDNNFYDKNYIDNLPNDVDGGGADAVYLPVQNINGGDANG